MIEFKLREIGENVYEILVDGQGRGLIRWTGSGFRSAAPDGEFRSFGKSSRNAVAWALGRPLRGVSNPVIGDRV